jgi:hypothetical protein
MVVHPVAGLVVAVLDIILQFRRNGQMVHTEEALSAEAKAEPRAESAPIQPDEQLPR